MIKGIIAMARFCFALLFTSCICFGQTPEIESLKRAIEKESNSKKLADLHCALGDKQFHFNFEDGYHSVNQSLEISKTAGYAEGVARALISIGKYYFYIGNHEKAQQHFRQVVQLKLPAGGDKFPAEGYMRLSILHRVQGHFDSAIWYLDKAENILHSQSPDLLHASVYSSRAMVLNNFSKNEDALFWMRKAHQIRRMHFDSATMSLSYRNTGVIFNDMAMLDSALFYFQKSLDIGKALNDPELLELTYLQEGYTHYLLGDFRKAFSNYSAAAGYMKRNVYLRYYGLLLYRLGEYFGQQGDFNSAFDYLFTALSEFEKINAQQDIARTYNQVAWCYTYQKNYESALENLEKSYQLALSVNDSVMMAASDNLRGYISYEEKNYQKALVLLRSALQVRIKHKLWWSVSSSMYNTALVHMALGQTDSAVHFLREAQAIDKRIGKKSGYIFTSNRLGAYFTQTRNFESAQKYLDEANRVAHEISLPLQLLENYKNYIRLYELMGERDKTIYYYRQHMVLKDSLDKALVSGKLADADAMYQLRMKVKEIELVRAENEGRQQKILYQEKELAQQRKLIWLYSIGFAVLTILIGIVFYLFRLNRKARKELEKQNFEILEKNEEISAQSEELTEFNQQLVSLNEELDLKNEEVEAQTRKIQEVNNYLERRIEERTEKLNKAYQELETFFYRTSHDFKRPLTTYLGLVKVARSCLSEPEALQLFEKVEETTFSFDRMLTKLQYISAVDYHSEISTINLQEIVAECIEAFTATIEEKKISVHIDANIVDHAITTNAFLLKAALVNVVENAIDFCCVDAPHIRIAVATSDHWLRISVEDNGAGIPEEVRHKIFDMYFRASDRSKGNGLGLYISRRAIEKLNGAITFNPANGRGTIFELTLPKNGSTTAGL